MERSPGGMTIDELVRLRWTPKDEQVASDLPVTVTNLQVLINGEAIALNNGQVTIEPGVACHAI